jgi:hypothetical protein
MGDKERLNHAGVGLAVLQNLPVLFGEIKEINRTIMFISGVIIGY